VSETKLCMCGQPLSKFGGSKSSLCRQCRVLKEQEKRAQKRIQKQAEVMRVAKETGLVLVHSCLSNAFDPERPCSCRRFVADEEARRLIDEEGAVNFNLRKSYFQRGEPILLANKRIRAPRASTIEAAHIQRGTERSQGKTSDQLKAEFDSLQRRIQLDLVEKAEEERLRWEVWADLQREFYRGLTIEIAESEWLAGERGSRGIPVVPLPVAFDLRTPNGIGSDVAVPAGFEQAAA